MPTIVSHVPVPLALGLGLGRATVSRRLLVAGMAASIFPDMDVVAFKLGIPYADAFGHRGASHSLAIALALGLIALVFARSLHTSKRTGFLFVGLSAASHGLLDMCTNGGLGVALWWPFLKERFFFPAQVIEVSPIRFSRIFSSRVLEVFQSELLWIWLPATVICLSLMAWRRWSPASSRSA